MRGSEWFRVAEVDARDVDSGAYQLPESWEAVIVHDVYEAEFLDEVVKRLDRHDPPFVTTWFPKEFRAFFYGVNLTNIDPDPGHYFRESSTVNRQINALFSPAESPIDRIPAILSELNGRRPIGVAPGRHLGEEYMFGTIRGHGEGGYIPPHFDARPLPDHLRSMVTNEVSSYVLMLGRPEGGGGLEVFRRMRPRQVADATTLDGETSGVESVTIELPVGSLITFDSSTFLHQVRPVQGTSTRWTLCSFMAPMQSGGDIVCWG